MGALPLQRSVVRSARRDFRVDLYVDGKLVDTNRAEWLESGHGAGIQFGRSLSSIKALMLGNRLTIVSEHGNSAFSLFGSYAATLKVADCLTISSG
jgi:hypothetical protein